MRHSAYLLSLCLDVSVDVCLKFISRFFNTKYYYKLTNFNIPISSLSFLSFLSKIGKPLFSLNTQITLSLQMDLSLVPFQQHTTKSQETHNHDLTKNDNNNSNNNSNYKYKECMRNHAASIGGHANDGCGEFMPRGSADDGCLTCAACGCHRNFHRREREGAQQHSLHYEHLFLSPPPPPLAQQILLYNAGGGGSSSTGNKKHLTSHHEFFDDEDDHDRRSETPERGEVNVGGLGGRATAAKNKRFRTKFTQEQKDRMLDFAEKIGWKINKQDDVALNQFCCEIGVKRNVLKVWMHNNKNAHRRTREEGPLPSTVTPPPTVPSQPVGV